MKKENIILPTNASRGSLLVPIYDCDWLNYLCIYQVKTYIQYMDVSKNRGGPPKWINFIMENPIRIDDLGGNTPIFGNTHIVYSGQFIINP